MNLKQLLSMFTEAETFAVWLKTSKYNLRGNTQALIIKMYFHLTYG